MKKLIAISLVLLMVITIIPSVTTAKKINNKEKTFQTTCLDGVIDGYTKYTIEGKDYSLPSAKIEVKNIFKRTTRSNQEGIYSIKVSSGPGPDKYFSVTASSDKIIQKGDKYYEIIPETKQAMLYFKWPYDTVNFNLECRETKDNEKIINSDIIEFNPESTKTGRISGNVYYTKGWIFYNLPFVIVDAGCKKDMTNLFGFYEINNLEVDRTYQLTVSTSGFKEKTIEVNLTKEKSDIDIDFELEESSSKSKSIENRINFIERLEELFPSSFFSANARSNLLSAFSFIS